MMETSKRVIAVSEPGMVRAGAATFVENPSRAAT